MPTPEEQRFDAISSALARLVKRHEELSRKQQELDARLARLERAGSADSETPLAHHRSDETWLAAVQQAPQPESGSTEFPELPPEIPSHWSRPALETKVGLTVANRVGVITLVLGVAFFFKWAVDNNWIGPGGRVVLGALAGFAALAAADFLWRKGQQIFAQGVTGTGIAILYLSIYAACDFYQLMPQGFAFALMCVATAMAVALALRYGAQAIAALGLFGGYLTPLLLSSGEDRPWFYLAYLLMLNAAAMTLALKKSWQGLEILSFGATVVLYATWIFHGSNRVNDTWPATLGALAYYALFSRGSVRPLFLGAQFLAAMVMVFVWPHSLSWFFLFELLIAAAGLAYAMMRRAPFARSVAFASFWIAFGAWNQDSTTELLPQFAGITAGFLLFIGWLLCIWSGRWSNAGRQPSHGETLAILALNGGLYYGFAYFLLNHDYHRWMGLLALGVASAYLSMGAYLHRRRRAEGLDLRPALLSFGVATAFATVAIPIQFNGFTVTMAWTLEAAALTWIGVRLESERAIRGALAVFALAAVRLLWVDSWTDSWKLADEGPYAIAIPDILVWNVRFLTFAVAAISFWLAAWWASRQSRRVALLEYFGGHATLLWGLSLEVVGWAERTTPPHKLLSVETVSISILLAIYAVILVGLGVASRTVVNRIAGLGLIALVIVKLYLFDVWQLERFHRISAFVALGILLLATSFLYSHFRRLTQSWWKDDG